jgi:AraC family transcriptional regulator of adaptative response / DNA-3-methyladenine glycosylase II
MRSYAAMLELAVKPPFRWEAIAGFLAARAIAGVESFDEGTYERVTGDGVVRVEPSLRLNLPKYAARVRRLFDLDADPAIIDAHLSLDPKLRKLIAKRPGPRVPGAWEPFEVAIRAIIGQQISVRGATTIMQRLVERFEGAPTPHRLAEDRLDKIGMPGARIEAIRSFARAVADDPSILRRGPTLEETIERLTALRGIGPWTANYIAMRALRETDAFPASDLGLRKAAAAIGIEPDLLIDRAERWRPYRAYAAIALWESL